MHPHHSEEKTEMQTPDRPERPERPEWLDAWEAIDDDAVQALADALAGDDVGRVAAALDALHALSGEWELVRVASPVEGSGGHEPFQSALARTIWETSRRDEGTISATGANIIAAALAPLVEARVREASEVTSETSDGYHTFAELYEYRMLYNVHAAQGWLAAGIPVVKSWYHSDGESCFGGGWFVVVATLPSGQVSNHYKSEHWGLFDVPEVSLPPEYDGHTPADAAARLHEALRAES